MDHRLYLLINLGAISIPFLAGFDRRLKFYRQWRFLFPAMLLTMLVFIPWDIAKTWLGVWGFNSRYVTGIYLGNLPLEEWLFFIAIPYACLFTYHALNYLIRVDIPLKWSRSAALVLGLFFLVVGFLNLHRLYTGITFLSAGVFLLLHITLFKTDYLGKFFRMYVITLLPFFIVNGLLTGSWIPEEVVYYDDSQNLGIRIGTIPVEDMVYGMLMLLMNVSWYEYLQLRFGGKLLKSDF